VERFGRNVEAYRRGSYNETQVRREFIDPLFRALGWDIDNQFGYAEAYKDVIHEDAIKVGGVTKAPDYCFRIGGTRKFFVEAKKPAINIKADVEPAFQLRRYAWSAKLPLSILTDFEEFAVYDCRVKPDKSDGAATARTIYLPYTRYDDEWDTIAGTFSKEAVLQGSFDKYAETTKGKKGTAEVDAAFLKEIEEWRDLLAHNLALRNPSLTQRELNYAVQATIDRLIFLRICEDRGVEDYGGLQTLLDGGHTYPRLLDLYTKADHRYNSGLFHFAHERGRGEGPDTLTPSLIIDDKALKDIIRRMYYPDSPYEFSVLPASILGQVYEQFLGKVIRLTAGHHAVVEDKPEVKKAGGVYYTPTYIVDYIVKNTVGKLLEGSTPKKASALRILDPACGSGSFLIGAYLYLLDWHRDWYIGDGPSKHTKELFTGPGGEWRLTTSEKKRILLNNIYGVDIDAQAVETTKLSLLLKVLEGETAETINSQLSFLHERALPDLADNIKCGNSLIGPDFYDDQQLGMLLDDEERYRVNVFDWEAELPQIMGEAVPQKERGFDSVIGNPPWLMPAYWDKGSLGYLASTYATATGKYDMYYLFLERGLWLLGKDGFLGLIVPNKFFHTKAASALRRLLVGETGLHEVVDFADAKLFRGATNYSCLVFIDRSAVSPSVHIRLAGLGLKVLAEFDTQRTGLTGEPWYFAPPASRSLTQRVEQAGESLETLVRRFATGVQSGADRVLVLSPERVRELGIEPQVITPLLRGRDVRRYALAPVPSFLLFPYRVENGRYVLLDEQELMACPRAWNYLRSNRERLSRRVWFGKGPQELSGAWYGVMYLEEYSSLQSPHLLTPCLSDMSNFALGAGKLFATGTAGVTGLVLRDGLRELPAYLLALLNSRLMSWYITGHSPVFQGGYHKFSAPYLRSAPIRRIDWECSRDVELHAAIANLGNSLSDLQSQIAVCRTPRETETLSRQAQTYGRQVDGLVYELYGLTGDEIALVDSSFTERS
jgi:hypothetical protein